MPLIKLIADSGSSKTDWCLIDGKTDPKFSTQGLSPYFLNDKQISNIISLELLMNLKGVDVDEIYFYGTGCASEKNCSIVREGLKTHFPDASIFITHDLMAAAKALCGTEPGIACILGTGSSCCYFDGKEIIKSSPGIGFILGDEGSGAFLGKKIIQYYLYRTFDEELYDKFRTKYETSTAEILNRVYREPLPNRYLASFTTFLSENRGHYMIENILEDGINDFFFNRIYKYSESWTNPIHFVGGVAHAFSDVIIDLCNSYQLTAGKILQRPIDGLTDFHINN